MKVFKAFIYIVLIFVCASCGKDIVYEGGIEKEIEKRELLREYNDEFFVIGGDMLIGKQDPQFQGLLNARINPKLKGVFNASVLFWPHGNVPYCFYDEIDESERATVRNAIETWESEANIDFIEQPRCENFFPADEEPEASDFMVTIEGEELGVYQIQKSTDRNAGGFSTLGYSTNYQRYYGFIDNDYGIAVHELGHCLGFSHEHQRPDRDDYIDILWHNIKLDYINNFFSLPLNSRTYSDIYDYDSIMHYPEKAFVRHWTMESINSYGHDIGQRGHLSFLDRLNVRCLYCTAYEATNAEHLAQNRATSDYRAIGSHDVLGAADDVTVLREIRRNYFELGSCCESLTFGDVEEKRRFTFTSSDLYDGSVGMRVQRNTGEATSIVDSTRVVSGHEADAANGYDYYYQGILHFNIGEIPDDQRVVSIQLQARFFNMNGPTNDTFILDLSENLRIDFDGYFGDSLELEGYKDFGHYQPPTEFWFEPEISILSDPAPHLPDLVTLSEETNGKIVNKFTWVLIELWRDYPRYNGTDNVRVLQLRVITSGNYLTGIQGIWGLKPYLIVETTPI